MFGKPGRRFRTSRLSGVAVLGIALCGALQARAECGDDRIAIEGSATEIVEACKAIEDIRDYFQRLDLTFDPAIRIRFADQVFIKFYSVDTSVPPLAVQVSGYFDSLRSFIEVTSLSSPAMGRRKPWGLPWSPGIAASVLRHELAHAAIHQNLGPRSKLVSKTWMEFMAYAVQIELADAALRAGIFSHYPDIAPFEMPERVNQFIYGYDPDEFAVRAYLFVKERGGPRFIRQLILGESGLDLQEIFWMK